MVDWGELFIQHITLFKVSESHMYARRWNVGISLKELSVSMMHKMYWECCAEYGHEVENNIYARVFREKF